MARRTRAVHGCCEGLERRVLLCTAGAAYMGRVFEDRNAGGLRNSDEPWLSRYTVEARTTYANSSGINREDTGADGSFSFPYYGCDSDSVEIVATHRDGWRQTTNNPLAGIGFGNDGEQLIGVTRRAVASGTLFNDTNGDGAVSADEPGVAQRVVFVDANDNGVLDAGERYDRTGSTGRWSFDNLPAGRHVLRLQSRSGLKQTLPSPDGRSGGAVVVDLARGEVKRALVFATHGAVVGGTVFNDLDANGRRDPLENGLHGWRVYDDANRNGSFDLNELTDFTDTNGQWSIAGLTAGLQLLRSEVRAGIPTTIGAAGVEVSAKLGTPLVGVRFGQRATQVVGHVFDDADGDLKRDSNETPIAGATVYVDSNDNGRLDVSEPATKTENTGKYNFLDLSAGSYALRIVVAKKTGWLTMSGDASGAHRITLAAGDTRTGTDVALVKPVTISGKVFLDRDKDGRMAGSEYALRNWWVYVDANGNGVQDAGETSQKTMSIERTFTFTGLRPGTHTLRVVRQPGWSYTDPGGEKVVTQRRSGAASEVFIGAKAAQVTGLIYFDRNHSRKWDKGDYAVEGFAYASLYPDADRDGRPDEGAQALNAQTIEGLKYTFDGLRPGHYLFTTSATWQFNGYSPASWADRAFGLDVAMGQVVLRDIPYVVRPKLSGTIFNDVNGNGIHDGESEDMSRVPFENRHDFEVYADLNDNGVFDNGDVTADVSGNNWEFWGPCPGRTVIRVHAPTGWTVSKAGRADGSFVYNLKPGQKVTNLEFAVRSV